MTTTTLPEVYFEMPMTELREIVAAVRSKQKGKWTATDKDAIRAWNRREYWLASKGREPPPLYSSERQTKREENRTKHKQERTAHQHRRAEFNKALSLGGAEAVMEWVQNGSKMEEGK